MKVDTKLLDAYNNIDFSSHESCTLFLDRLFPQPPKCPRCSGKKILEVRRGNRLCSRCQKEFSPISNTVFSESKTSLAIWFEAIKWICEQEIAVTAQGLQREMKLGSNRTALRMLNIIRHLISKSERTPLTIWGDIYRHPLPENKIVTLAIDFYNKKPSQTLRVKGIRMTAGEDWSRLIDPNSFVMRPEFAVKPTDQRRAALIFQEVEMFLRLSGWRKTGDRKQLQVLLDEFTFRFNNRRNSPAHCFVQILKQVFTSK